ncbi:hypothetical protein magsdc_127 [Candidatus Hodgkinia cicadicola]|uniref:Reverse transcriptase domain-containing protein n=1 Tax=Candidatus Hodgkinia cicadicola TaxID=573658 RepID=A0ABX4MGS3_9HYPH|nr:hypothetical protein magtdc_118 [Candidatus Hodgkinia cicadicola]PIM96171.1 hypothetical protein magsdc_127 [Candidatus Hodgkinia cicadicola]
MVFFDDFSIKVLKTMNKLNKNTILLSLPEIAPNHWFNGVPSKLSGIPFDKTHRTWFSFQPIVWQFQHILPNINPTICIGKTKISNTLTPYIGISNAATTLWGSFIPNLITAIETCRSISPNNETFTLNVSCRDVYDSIVDICAFNPPIPNLLKSCFGNHVALKTLLSTLDICSIPPGTKRLRVLRNETYTRLLDLYTTVNKILSPFGRSINANLLAQTVAIKSCYVNSEKLNKFRRLLSTNIEINQTIRLLWGLPRSLGATLALKRLKDNLNSIPNLTIYHRCFSNKQVSPNTLAFSQLTKSSSTCFLNEARTISNRVISTGLITYHIKHRSPQTNPI